MGLLTTTITFFTFSSAAIYTTLRHYQLRRGPKKMDWSGSVFAYRGRNFANFSVKKAEFEKLLAEQKERMKAEKSSIKQKSVGGKKKKNRDDTASVSTTTTTAAQGTATSNKNNTTALTTSETSKTSTALTTENTINSPSSADPFNFVATLPKIVAPNSLAALEYAQANHASGVHVDVRVCKSGELILFQNEFVFPTLKPAVQLELHSNDPEKQNEIMKEFVTKRVSDFQLWELREMIFAEEDALKKLESQELSGLGAEKKSSKKKSSAASKKKSENSETKQEEVFANWARNKIITLDECVAFCHENSLKLTLEVHADSGVWGLPHAQQKAQLQSSRSKLLKGILNLYSSNPFSRDTTSIQNNRAAKKWFESETMIVSDDPWLLYKIRDANWTIPCGTICTKNWLASRISDRVYSYDVPLQTTTPATASTNESALNYLGKEAKFVDSRPWYAKTQIVDKIIDPIMHLMNLRLTPWFTGCSAVVLPKEYFSKREVEKWRMREFLVYWQGFGSEPEKFTQEMRDEASGETLLQTPEAKAQDALMIREAEENPYAKWEFRTPQLYKKKPLGGSCVVVDDSFIKFFP